MLREERSFDEDKRLLENFFKEHQNCDALDDVLEEISVLWCDDLPYIIMMIMRTLSGLRASHTELRVPAKFKSEEDPEFVKTLFEKAWSTTTLIRTISKNSPQTGMSSASSSWTTSSSGRPWPK